MFNTKNFVPNAICVALSSLLIAGSVSAQTVTNDTHGRLNSDWWPEQLNLSPLRQHDSRNNPLGDDFNYAEAFEQLDLNEVKADLVELMTTSQDWWPADWGHYGPFFIRMAWHSTGTYRDTDGRGGAEGGQQRFEPLNSWPDNVNLDRARRLLWPLKQKYGENISWGDLMVLTGTVAMESMGFNTIGFAGGRVDEWQADIMYWGPEQEWLTDERHDEDRRLNNPLAATEMGLIYVNPEGPNGNPDPLAAAQDIRSTFARMAMNDEETVALIAGGHNFGKAHGAHKPTECTGVEPAAAGLEEQALGWVNTCGTGNAENTVTSGLEGAWSAAPTQWTMQFLQNLFGFEWEQTRSPAGAIQWIPVEGQASGLVPDAHLAGVRHAPIMFTTDIALREDPIYRDIAQRFLNNPEEFEAAFGRAWFKLTHRDMGPRTRYLGDLAPDEEFIWQDPVPAVDHDLITDRDISRLKTTILESGLTVPELVRTAWASASSFRGSDMRGGANGARVRLEPQINWDVNNPDELTRVLATLEGIQNDFNSSQRRGNKRVSLADIIVLAGNAAIEQAASEAGYSINVDFVAGRTDASQEQTDVNSFAVLRPWADGFRNYYNQDSRLTPPQMLVDRANQLTLTVPEMSVLVAGMRVLDANYDGSQHGVFTDNPGTLTNDFFVNLLDMRYKWQPAKESDGLYVAFDRSTGEQVYTATPVDLIFGSNTELRAVAELYASETAKQRFVEDFAKAWSKVMHLDRFDIKAN